MRFLRQALNECGINKGINHRDAFISQVAILLLRELGLQPHDNVTSSWCNSIWPVIEPNGVVGRTAKRLRVFEGDNLVLLSPLESLLADESQDATILLLDAFGPLDVATEMGWQTLEKFEAIIGCSLLVPSFVIKLI